MTNAGATKSTNVERSVATWMRWAGVLCAALVVASGLLVRVDWAIEDAIAIFDRQNVKDEVTIVGLDRESLENLGDRVFDPVLRAQTIENLVEAGAKRVFVDFGMAQLGSIETAAQVREILGPAIFDKVAFPIFSGIRHSTDGRQTTKSVPDPVLQSLASVASVAVPVDLDGTVRRMFEMRIHEGIEIASAPHWLTGQQARPGRELRVNFAIDLHQIPAVSLIDAWRGHFDPDIMAGRYVILGATDLVLGDQLLVPRFSIIAGSEFLAMAVLTLISDLALTEVEPLVSAGLAVIIAFVAAHLFFGRRPKSIAMATLCAIVAVLVTTVVAQTQFQLLLQPSAPMAALLIVASFSILQRSGWMERRQRQSESIIQQQSALIGKVFASSRDGILTIDGRNRVISANDAMNQLAASNPSGRTLDQLFKPPPLCLLEEKADNGSLMESELQVGSDQPVPVEIAVNTTVQDGNRLTIVMVRDLRERKAQEKQLTTLATCDSLTGIANRYGLEQSLARSIDRCASQADSFGLILIDLDQFKEINDTLGHGIGDAVLKIVAERLRQVAERCSCIARLGGDEFALISKSEEDLANLAQRVYEALTGHYRLMDLTLELGASLGVAQFPAHGADAEKLLQCADVAMYQAKRAGGGVQIYDRALDEHSVRRLTLKGQLRTAIDNDDLVLHYQPKVDAQTGRLAGSEALVRWVHPELGFMPPDEFIPAAEQSGVIKSLTLWCFERALKDKQSLAPALRALPISINVSARLLSEDEIRTDMLALLERYGMQTDDITLEITESAIMTNVEQSLIVLNKLEDCGFKLSLDDFGAGYSSFDYLRRLPVRELKIDRTFLTARSQDLRASEILKGMIALGQRLNMSVVCEGVETAEEFEWLRDQGCDIIQGYFTGKPQPVDQFSQLPIAITGVEKVEIVPACSHH